MFEAIDIKRKEDELVCDLLYAFALHPLKYSFALGVSVMENLTGAS